MNRRQFLKGLGIVLAAAALPITKVTESVLLLPPGTIQAWVGSKFPRGWVLCDGSEVSARDYPDLFVALGEMKSHQGEWDGKSTGFNLPDLRSTYVVKTSVPKVNYIIKT